MSIRIQIRRDTSANWASVDPILAAGEWGLDLTQKKVKLGDGSTPWSSLPWATDPAPEDVQEAVASYLAGNPPDDSALNAHIAATRPHPNAESGKGFAAWFTAQTV